MSTHPADPVLDGDYAAGQALLAAIRARKHTDEKETA